MKIEAVALSLFTSTLVLVPGAAFAQHKPTEKPEKPEATAPAPKPAKPSYWLAADPHVPLAVVDAKQIRGVGKRGKECGAASRWAKPKSRWHAIDAHGEITGHYEVAGAETFDLTACREVVFKPLSGKPGVGLFVSDDSGYKPAASPAFSPSAQEKKRFDQFVGTVESAFVDHKPLGKALPIAKRTLFFEMTLPKDATLDGRVDGNGKPIVRPHRWAVVGGPVLVVAYLGQGGQWHVASVKTALGLADSYMPEAVFDMNGDGLPELIVRQSDGSSFADVVMSVDPKTMKWEDAAESPGGALL
jgi:hypothetical protein